MEQGDLPSHHLMVMYKTAILMIRAYQDSLCRVLLISLGLRAGGYTSMSKALKNERNLVRLLIQREVPEYPDWFSRWRELRNRVKSGAPLGLTAMRGDVGVVFSHMEGASLSIDLSGTNIVSLADVADGLAMSSALARSTTAQLVGLMSAEEAEALEGHEGL
jgi:hypothetical protein